MEKFGLGLLLIIWMIFTVLFTISIVGLVLILPDVSTGEKSSWMRMGMDITNKI